MTNNGVNFGPYNGLQRNQLPSLNAVETLCHNHNIRQIIMSEQNTTVLVAFLKIKIGFSLGIPNNLLEEMVYHSSTLLALFTLT